MAYPGYLVWITMTSKELEILLAQAYCRGVHEMGAGTVTNDEDDAREWAQGAVATIVTNR